MHIGLYVKYPLFFKDLNETWNFRDRFSKNTEIYFIKIRLVGAELFIANGWTDGQTDRQMTRPRVAFRNFSERP
jgi:hypothetical protein